MKFSTRTEVDRPAAMVFAALSDFARLERMFIRRGIDARRMASSPADQSAWALGFDWRGRRRDLTLAVAQITAPERLSFDGLSDGFEIALDLTVVALSRARSRIIVETDVRPRTMRSRLMIQTARLGKSQLDHDYDRRIVAFLAEVTA